MLKVVAMVNNRRTLFCGLDRENTKRLHAGQPIAIDAQAVAGAPVLDVVLFAGETLEDCHAELGKYIELPDLPEAMME